MLVSHGQACITNQVLNAHAHAHADARQFIAKVAFIKPNKLDQCESIGIPAKCSTPGT